MEHDSTLAACGDVWHLDEATGRILDENRLEVRPVEIITRMRKLQCALSGIAEQDCEGWADESCDTYGDHFIDEEGCFPCQAREALK